MTDPGPRLQPGVTLEHHALLAEANRAAKAFPGGPEALAQAIATGLAASRRRPAERHVPACCAEPGAGLAEAAELEARGPRGPSASYAEGVAGGWQPEPEAGP